MEQDPGYTQLSYYGQRGINHKFGVMLCYPKIWLVSDPYMKLNPWAEIPQQGKNPGILRS